MKTECPLLNRVTTVKETSFSRDSWSVVECQETGFVFLANPPDYSRLETEYAWEATATEEQQRRKTEQPVVSRLSYLGKRLRARLFPGRNKIAALTVELSRARPHWEPLQLLDIGCGSGYLMTRIHREMANCGRSVMPCGIEVSRQLAICAGEEVAGLGGRVISASAVDGLAELAPGSVHVAIMSSFLEHESRPRELLERLRGVLTEDGAVILKVPNFACWNRKLRGRRWCGFRYPDHVNYFAPETLAILAHESGYAVTRQNLVDRLPLSDNMYAVLSRAA